MVPHRAYQAHEAGHGKGRYLKILLSVCFSAQTTIVLNIENDVDITRPNYGEALVILVP